MPTALFQRISDAPRPDPLRSNPFSPELREAQSVVKRRPVPTRASLPPLQTHELEGTLPQHSREHDPVAPAPIVLPAPAQSKSPNKRDRRALQKSSPGSSVCRHASFRKTDTHMEVLSNEDGIECVIITMQPGASTPSRKTSARRSRDGSRSDKRSSYYSERPSDTSPVKDDGSPGPSRPRVVHSPSRSVSSRKCSGVIEISYRPEFGQRLSQFDIVATKIENALNELR
ncbi:hypothetical protein CERZMDRAFT_91973 [Cercospora zeae-maydis SCOH1-5]|uniref:Uncharacterized protein n=1 Tax=Cercospora zeae-maydis SCOH1-5 TaxID=717836 RepID=A0A6A6EZP7_9PEZI|nr:hypothetical protein CERZMDRAFT_91973 [Cercospora zeae-maydis SCOH1-5]